MSDTRSSINQATTYNGTTALYPAALNGQFAIIEMLLKQDRIKDGININLARTDNGVTALWIAAQQGNTDIIKRLLENEAIADKAMNESKPDAATPLYSNHNMPDAAPTGMIETNLEESKTSACPIVRDTASISRLINLPTATASHIKASALVDQNAKLKTTPVDRRLTLLESDELLRTKISAQALNAMHTREKTPPGGLSLDEDNNASQIRVAPPGGI